MKTIFIGNRVNVVEKILKDDNLELSKIFVLKNSPLHHWIIKLELEYELFDLGIDSKETIIQYLKKSNEYLLISNGCPFKLPIKDLKTKDNIFINIHPTYLPELKGKTPLNGVLYLKYDFVGATMHFMDDGIDTGNIIYKEKVAIGPDVDQGLIYYLSFLLEGEVFLKGIELLFKSKFNLVGEPQNENTGSYFNRDKSLFEIDFENDSNEDIARKVKSVGISSLGVVLFEKYKAFEAEEVINDYLLRLFEKVQVGSIALVYGNRLMVRTKQGLMKFYFEEV